MRCSYQWLLLAPRFVLLLVLLRGWYVAITTSLYKFPAAAAAADSALALAWALTLDEPDVNCDLPDLIVEAVLGSLTCKQLKCLPQGLRKNYDQRPELCCSQTWVIV